ncbi:MAG TPA: glycoside hydrolase family 95 protein, partial [Chitinophagaceae bacterium]|nr:glycoside hydrolase family 95 protein [Chitinophagaceae bacterium]
MMMKKKPLYYFFPALVLFQCLSFYSQAQSSSLQLWYNKPAVKWTEALPIGNGRLGAMIFGGVEEDRVQYNEETLWTGEPRNYNRPNAHQYLDSIRQLLFNGQQKEAELLAGEKFMGLKSHEGQRATWLSSILSLKGVKGNPALEDYDDSQWKLMDVPSYEGWEAIGFDGLDGAVWLRTSFDLPADWSNKNLILDLNRIRDQDFTYVNGKQVGGMESTEPRKYRIAKDILHPGKNSIAILVLNFDNKGGITGYKDSSRKIGIYPEGEEGKNIISIHRSWKYWIQDDNPPPIGKYQADYQPFGDLWLKFTHQDPVTNYRRELDLSTALSSVSYSVNSIQYKREYLASQPKQVIAVHLTASKPGAISFETSLSSPHKNYSLKKTGPSTLVLSLAVRNGALRGISYLHVTINKGTISATNEKIIVRNADEATVYVTAGTNFRNYKDISADPAATGIKTLKALSGKSYESIRREHIKEYTNYFNTLSIDLGQSTNESLPTDERITRFASTNDPSFVALYLQYGRYLLIASSRPGTRPANLQGIWNDLLAPPWGSKYTTNINAEMNYWPAELLNLSAMHEPLFTMINELSITGRETAKAYYGAPGWVLHHNTDLWRGTAPINASNHGIWVTGGAWLCEHLWEHYLFTQDKVFLENRAYPIMKQA